MKKLVKNILTGTLIVAFGGLNLLAMDIDPNVIIDPTALTAEISEYSGVSICFDSYGSFAHANYQKRGLISRAVADTYMEISLAYAVSDCAPWVWANIQAGDATDGRTSETIVTESGRRTCTASAYLERSDGNADFAYHSALLDVSGSEAMSGSYNGATGSLQAVRFPVS